MTVPARIAAVAVFLLALVPFTGDYAATVGGLAVVLGIVALGFVVLTGWAGDISLGQVVPYGLGAYATYWLSARADLPVALAIVVGALVVMPIVAMIGVAALRLDGLELAIATLALAVVSQLMVFPNLGRWLGGRTRSLTQFSSTVVRVNRPDLFSSNRAFYVGALLLGAAAFALVAALGRSRFGRAWREIRDDSLRAETLGVATGAYRVGAFVIAGFLAALAGGVAASLRGAVTADTFTFFDSINFLAIAVIGGLATPAGALLAGAFGALLPELARLHGFRFLQGRLTLVYGAGLLVLLAVRPGGLASLVGWDRRGRARFRADSSASSAPRSAQKRRDGGALLRIDDVTVEFGGVRALDGVSLRIAEGDEVAVIGPNGAGKSTWFQVIDGLLTPATGRVYFGGDDVTTWPTYRRARAGVARTFQTVRAFDTLTIGEHVGDDALLDQLGLRDHTNDLPGQLPYGALRRLELATVLASSPRLLLLDEPTAGMDPTEAAQFCDVLAALNAERGITVLLVEHDMAVVGRLARRVMVLDRGSVIADGTPAAIAKNRAVIESYLGTAQERTLARAAR